MRNHLKSMMITERELYLWSFRVGTEPCKKFRDWLATTVLPNLREYGIYTTGMENMSVDQIRLVIKERTEAYVFRKYGINIRRSLTDTIKECINPQINESGRYYGGFTNIIYNVLFGSNCKEYKESIGATEKDNLRDYLRDMDMAKELNLISKAEDMMANFIMAGIQDENQLKISMTTWYNNYKKMSNQNK